jgi:hypothetical protein
MNGARISSSHNLQIVQQHVFILACERGPAIAVLLPLRHPANSVIDVLCRRLISGVLEYSAIT